MIIVSLLLFVAVYWFSQNPASNQMLIINRLTTVPIPSLTTELTPYAPDNNFTIDSVNVAYVVIDEPQNLELIANFKENLFSVRIEKEYHCRFLTNGGFYTEDKKPTGLFITNDIVYREKVSSNFLNGFFSVDKNNQAIISVLFSLAPVKFSLQSGPLLFSEGLPAGLKIKDDFSARRVAVGTTTDDKLIFMVFYNQESQYDGPKLSALPQIIAEINSKVGLNLKNALNLDGGSASLFMAKNTRLSELSQVGSFLCLK